MKVAPSAKKGAQLGDLHTSHICCTKHDRVPSYRVMAWKIHLILWFWYSLTTYPIHCLPGPNGLFEHKEHWRVADLWHPYPSALDALEWISSCFGALSVLKDFALDRFMNKSSELWQFSGFAKRLWIQQIPHAVISLDPALESVVVRSYFDTL